MIPALVGVTFVLAAFFPIAFAARSDWYSNPPGRSLMAFSIIVAAVLGLVVLRQLGVELPTWTRAVVYSSIAVGLLAQDVTLVKTQNRRSARLAREREDEEAVR